MELKAIWEEVTGLMEPWIGETPPEIVLASAGVIFLLLIWGLTMTGRKRRRRRQVMKTAPHLVVEDFRVSPMGRDAFLKVKNEGSTATVSLLEVQSRNDIQIKNQLAGQVIESGAPCRILLEAKDTGRVDDNIALQFTFLDQSGNVFKQKVQMNGELEGRAKLQYRR